MLLYNFALEYAIRMDQVIQNGLKLNVTIQLLVYADDVNILGRSIHTIKKNAEALIFTGKEVGLEVKEDKTKYMFMPRDKNAGRSHNIKVYNSSFERIVELKYLGTILTNQNSVTKNLGADRSQGMLAVIRCRIFRLLFW